MTEIRSLTPKMCPPAEFRKLVARIGAQLSKLPENRQRLFKKYLTVRDLERVPPVSDRAVEQLADWAVTRGLNKRGSGVFQDPLCQEHLNGLWSAMRTGTPLSRKAAKDRWLEITRISIPDLRRFKDKRPTPDIRALETDVSHVRETVRDFGHRFWGEDDLPTLRVRLERGFPHCPTAKIARLAQAMVDGDPEGIRRAIFGIAGHRFGRGPSGVRDLLAAHRSRRSAKNLRQISAGKQRYVDWLHKRGLAPPRPVVRLLPPPTAR